ncbi:hypothetical protein BECAL_02309 [Bellilinea caldifistulae]|uniref:hypothetical protein n=1 Tax=Bellilinea caldifistulae TaxID=360411 RepID=UPI000784EF77|nr:hypothetical protein [Bellilinea caldifistulae]GAP11124.1 hypothetical protein BECAL_02309 [Bellilinea caldifistulae]
MADNITINLHNSALELADKAYIARKNGDLEMAKFYALCAMSYEVMAAKRLLPNADNEPTRSVIYRSAATLAIWGGDYISALHYAREGKSSYTPADIRHELDEIEKSCKAQLQK